MTRSGSSSGARECADDGRAILDPDDEALWLDPGPIAPIKILLCLRPFPSERMEAIPVSSLVSSPDNEGPELIEPVLA